MSRNYTTYDLIDCLITLLGARVWGAVIGFTRSIGDSSSHPYPLAILDEYVQAFPAFGHRTNHAPIRAAAIFAIENDYRASVNDWPPQDAASD